MIGQGFDDYACLDVDLCWDGCINDKHYNNRLATLDAREVWGKLPYELTICAVKVGATTASAPSPRQG